MLLTRSADGTWTLVDEDGVMTLARPPVLPLGTRIAAARYLVRVAWQMVVRGHP